MYRLLADSKSHFSIGESMLKPEEIAAGAKAAGYNAAALCDVMTISGMPDFTKACDKEDIKPVIGVRLRIVPNLDKVDKVYTVFPKLYILSQTGFEIVTQLLSLAYDDDHFYRVPRLTFDDVIEAIKSAKGHIAYSTGSLYSALRDSNTHSSHKRIQSLLTSSMTFAELVPGNSAVWDRQAEEAYKIANEFNLPILLSRPTLYDKANGADTLSMMSSIVNNHKRDYGNRFDSFLKDYRVTPPKDIVTQAITQSRRIKVWAPTADVSLIKNAMTDWHDLCVAVDFKWHKLDVSLPKMAPDENAELWRLAKEGLRRRMSTEVFGYKPKELKPYVERLKYEMDVLTDMGFAGYFLLTQEIVKWSKDNGIVVGPGRGSVGGSLVAYVLDITDVDPIRFGLIFERFINPERLDLPDADLDFMSTRRHEVIQHIRDQYGEEFVAGISNYTTLQSKGALSDLSRILGDVEGQSVGKFIPSESGTAISLERALEEVSEVKSFSEKKPELWQTACDIEGRIRSMSVHAAGIVVAGEPLTKRAVVERRSGQSIVGWDKRVVEEMGLVKMDILGLSTLDLLFIALKKIKERTGKTVDLNSIPLDNEEILKAFGTGQTVGIFQFESGGMRKLLKDIYKTSKRITFEEVSACTALYRPGPMESGLMDDFVNIKQGLASETYEHPSMQPALEETYSVIVYQEQVMRIAQDLCSFTMAQADHLRKAIGKKDMVKMKEQGDSFIAGAVGNGMPSANAEILWDKIVKFAGYAFNKSHSVEYTLISYQAMWLKVFYPLEFFAAAMTVLKEEKRPALIKDSHKWGIQVSPPDVNYSTNEFEILTDDRLVAPFSIMKGLSERGAKEILLSREDGKFKDAKDFEDRVPRRVVNKTVRSKLDLVGAFSRIEVGQLPSDHESRRTDQLELIPSIMSGGAIVTRELCRDKAIKEMLTDELEHWRDNPSDLVGEAVFVGPRMGKRPKFMVVFDGPGYHDEQAGKFATAGMDAVEQALDFAGLEIGDAYWTGLCKTPKKKGEKLYSPEMIHEYKELLDKEVQILNPQVVLCLGTNSARHFFPGMKGSITEHAGKILYQKATDGLDNDRNIIIGITPGMIYFDGTKQIMLDEAFGVISEML